MHKPRRGVAQADNFESTPPWLTPLVGQCPTALQVFTRNGESVFANVAAGSLLSPVPKDHRELLPSPLDADAVRARVLAGETVTVATKLHGKHRATRVEVTLFPLRDATGKITHLGASYQREARLREAPPTDKKEGVAKLRLSALMGSLTDGVIFTDPEGRIRGTNSAARRITQMGQGDENGKPFQEVFRAVAKGSGLPVPADALLDAKGSPPPSQLYPVKAPDTAVSFARGHVCTANGEPAGAVWVVRAPDAERSAVHEQDELTVERVHALGRLQHILEGMPIACIVTGSDLRIEYTNPAASHLLGQRSNALLSRPSAEAIGQPSPANLIRLREGKASSQRRVSVRRPGGGVSICDWYITPLLGPNKELAGAVFMGVDATSQALAETRLRRSERRYRSLVQTTSSVVWMHDPSGRFAVPQVAWQHYTGQTWPAQRGLGWTDAIHPDDRAHALASWEQASRDRTAYEFEGRIFHRVTGKHRHVVARVAPILGEGDSVSEWIGTLTDVDDRKRARDELVRLEAQNREMQQASRLKSEFLANMSHELRTPLNAILGFAELLADHLVEPESPRYDEFLSYILSSGRHLLQLINDVLDLAKVEAGKLEFFPEPVEVEQVVREVLGILHSNAVSSGVRVDTEIPTDFPSAQLDPGRFKQVLFNYLSNALKFTPRGGQVTVRIIRQAGDFFRLEVEDNGIGIAPEHQLRLFLEFQQLDPGTAKKHGGTGLGLALTKRLVEAQGGSVGVRSQLGLGSTFWATLPLGVAKKSAPAAEAKSRVLVVEDGATAPGQPDQVSRLLRDEGYLVERAHSLVSAAQQCSLTRYDAIALDAQLPEADGLTLLPLLEDSELNKHTPVVVTTLDPSRKLTGMVVREAMYKPLDTAKLLLAIGRAQGKRGDGMQVLIIEDDPASQRLLQTALEPLRCRATVATTAQAALALVEDAAPDCIVLDASLPDLDTTPLLERLRAHPACRDTPILIWTMRDLTGEGQGRLTSLARGLWSHGSADRV